MGHFIQDWTKLQILPFFVDFPRKIAAVTIFRTLRFFITFLFFSLTSWGFWSPQNNSAKIAKNRGCNYLWYFTIFRYSFAFLTYQAGFRIQQILRKKKGKNRGRNDFSLLTIRRYILFFSLIRRHFRIEQILPKLKKSWSHFTMSRYFFVVITYREGFQIQPIPRKVEKIVPIPPFNIFPYVFITY